MINFIGAARMLGLDLVHCKNTLLPMPAKRKQNKPALNLALQGGGAHGAYTWGVLDRLLEEDRYFIEAISGTSAGAVNAVVTAAGLQKGGPEQARLDLHDFWKAISDAARFSIFKRNPLAKLFGDFSLESSPAFLGFDLLSRVLSPYDFNPFGLNPLRDLLADHVDWAAVKQPGAPDLFVSATDVRSGRVKVFRNKDLKPDAVLASACLPMLFQAVEIDGGAYWDGGYMGNPSLWPFSYECGSNDILIVQINPVYREEVPRTSREILNRINEITFNASLLRELRAMDFVSRLIEEETLKSSRYNKMLVHMITSEPISKFGAASKFNAEWDFLEELRDRGRRAADDWLVEHGDAVGNYCSVNLRSLFEDDDQIIQSRC
ncbi:MAG: patatin-like phospholipase family protein [Pseudomonadota bacterium]